MPKPKKYTIEEILKLINNIKRFDDKEIGADYFAGWDNALDTVIMDLNEVNKGERTI